jgi:Fe-S cluster assembly protein SufD
LGGPAWLQAIRRAGAARFAELGLPHHRQEAWRFTNIAPIVKAGFRPVLNQPGREVSAEEIKPLLYCHSWPRIVFVDGVYAPSLTSIKNLPTGVRFGSLAHTVASGDAGVQQHLAKHAGETSGFVAMNSALLHDGVFLNVLDGITLDEPVHVLHVATGAREAAAHPRNLVVLGASAQASIVESYIGLSQTATYLTNAVSEFAIGDNAALHRYKIVEEGAAGHHLESAAIAHGRDSKLEAFAITLTGKIVRNEMNVVLAGEGSNAELKGLYLNDGDRLIDNYLHVTHAASHCYSRMGYKGVLDGGSSAVFTGKVHVHPGAQKTDSNQLNNNLLLSGDATIDTKPQLEIFADDVKCTHGATIGGFPREHLFYFQSRGMTAAMANAILTYGFASEVVHAIEVPELRARLAKYVFDKYSPK